MKLIISQCLARETHLVAGLLLSSTPFITEVIHRKYAGYAVSIPESLNAFGVKELPGSWRQQEVRPCLPLADHI